MLPLSRLPAVLMLLLGAGCSKHEIRLTVLPEGGCTATCGLNDISCLDQLGLRVFAGDVSQETPAPTASTCVEVPPSEERSLCDLDLGEVARLSVPEGTATVELWAGQAGEGGDCDAAPLFVGGVVINSEQPEARMTARCLLSCGERVERSIELTVRDFSGDRALDIDRIDVEVGLLYDKRALMFPSAPFGQTEYGPFPMQMERVGGANPRVRLTGAMPESTPRSSSCLAARIRPTPEGRAPAVTCTPALLEGDTGSVQWATPEVERKVRELIVAADGNPDSGYLVVRLEDQATEQPVADGTVIGLPGGVRVLYGVDSDFNATAPPPVSTTDSGLFVVLGAFVGEVSIEAFGYSEQKAIFGILPDHTGWLTLSM